MTQPLDLQDLNITIAVHLASVPVPAASFDCVLLACPVGAAPFPSGALTREYIASTYVTELAADVTATYITQATADQVTKLFSQTPKPRRCKVGTVAWATLAADLAALIALDNDWYALNLYQNGQTPAQKETNIQAAAVVIEGLNKQMIIDTEDPECYGAVSTDLMSLEKALGHKHTTAFFSQLVVPGGGVLPGTVEQPVALCAAARWLAWDPDVKSVPFVAQVTGVVAAALTASGVPLSSAQKGYIEGKNGNAVWLFGSAPAFISKGTTASGHTPEMVLSAHWLEARVRERLADMVVAAANRGDKIGLDATGAAMVAAEINAVLQQGVAAGHWTAPSLGAATINQTTKKISFENSSVVPKVNALNFGLTVYFE